MVNASTLTVLIATMISHSVAGYAQLEKLRFEHITVEQGLSDNNALCVGKDANGYMWFGTWNGLNKYDGYTVTNYFTDPNDPQTLSYNTIFSIYPDNNKKLCYGCRRQCDYLRYIYRKV
jgi:ligand-binding sensor domain-containing protein